MKCILISLIAVVVLTIVGCSSRNTNEAANTASRKVSDAANTVVNKTREVAQNVNSSAGPTINDAAITTRIKAKLLSDSITGTTVDTTNGVVTLTGAVASIVDPNIQTEKDAILRWNQTTMRKQYTAAFKAKLVLELLKETKSLSQLAAEHKVHPNQLRQWRDGALKELPTLFDKKDHTADVVAAHERQVEELYAEIGRLTTHVAWLKKNLVSTLPRASRLALIDREDGQLPLVAQAELRGLSRASLYYRRVPPAAKEIAIKHRIDELYTAHPFYGARRLLAARRIDHQSQNRAAIDA